MTHFWKKVENQLVDEKTFTKKSKNIFLFSLKDIKIPDIFYKILKFLGTSWALVIAHKDLLL